MASKDQPAGDENAAAAVPVEGSDAPIVVDPKAADTSGAKMIRMPYGDRFVVDDKTEVDGNWREFNATAAKKVIEAARDNGVTLHVADKKG